MKLCIQGKGKCWRLKCPWPRKDTTHNVSDDDDADDEDDEDRRNRTDVERGKRQACLAKEKQQNPFKRPEFRGRITEWVPSSSELKWWIFFLCTHINYLATTGSFGRDGPG